MALRPRAEHTCESTAEAKVGKELGNIKAVVGLVWLRKRFMKDLLISRASKRFEQD